MTNKRNVIKIVCLNNCKQVHWPEKEWSERAAKFQDLLHESRISAGRKFLRIYIIRSYIAVFKQSGTESYPESYKCSS